MRSTARLVASCLLGVALLFAGCAEEEGAEPKDPKSAASAAPAQATLDPVTAQATVTQYYKAIDRYSYRRAWTLLGPEQRTENQGFSTWRAGYDLNIETNLTNAIPTAVDPDTATVAVKLNTLDSDACGNDVHQTFEGTWMVDLVGARPVLSDANVSKVGGPDPVFDASSCAPAPAAPPPEDLPTSDCDENYAGACLDPYSSDYDCEGGTGDGPDYTGSVQVVGDDHYGLDRDGDGFACE